MPRNEQRSRNQTLGQSRQARSKKAVGLFGHQICLSSASDVRSISPDVILLFDSYLCEKRNNELIKFKKLQSTQKQHFKKILSTKNYDIDKLQNQLNNPYINDYKVESRYKGIILRK